MNKELVKAALIRVQRTLVEYITSSVPAGFIVTPVMLQNLDARYVLFVFLAWLITGLIQCGVAFFWAIEQGLPEVEVPDEVRSADVIKEPVQHYIDEDAEYDYLRIDENVDEGEEDEVGSED